MLALPAQDKAAAEPVIVQEPTVAFTDSDTLTNQGEVAWFRGSVRVWAGATVGDSCQRHVPRGCGLTPGPAALPRPCPSSRPLSPASPQVCRHGAGGRARAVVLASLQRRPP